MVEKNTRRAPREPAKLEFRLHSLNDKERKFDFSEHLARGNRVWVGRRSASHLALDDQRNVSRLHGFFFLKENRLYFKDQSRFGTWHWPRARDGTSSTHKDDAFEVEHTDHLGFGGSKDKGTLGEMFEVHFRLPKPSSRTKRVKRSE